jgi:hypothetical protein
LFSERRGAVVVALLERPIAKELIRAEEAHDLLSEAAHLIELRTSNALRDEAAGLVLGLPRDLKARRSQ